MESSKIAMAGRELTFATSLAVFHGIRFKNAGIAMLLPRFVMVLVLLTNYLAAVTALSAGEPNQQRPQRKPRITLRAQTPTAGRVAENSPVAESSYAGEAETVYYTDGYVYEKEKSGVPLFLSRANRSVYNTLSRQGRFLSWAQCRIGNTLTRQEQLLSYAHRGIYDLLAKKERKHRKAYFLHTQKYHKDLLNPVISPVCTANFGYHKTCWRQFPEICDPCPPAVPVEESLSPEALPPTPEAEPSAEANSSSTRQSLGIFHTLAADYEVQPLSAPEELESVSDLPVQIDAERGE